MTYGSGTVVMPIFRRTMIGICGLISLYVTMELAGKPIYAQVTTKLANVRRTPRQTGDAQSYISCALLSLLCFSARHRHCAA